MNVIRPIADPQDEAGHEVTAGATRNREALLRFWEEGLSWTRDEVNTFIDGLAKLP